MRLCVDSNQILFVAAQPDHSSERIQLFPHGFHSYLLLDRYIFRMRENTEVPKRPAHLCSAVSIVAAVLVSDCHCWDELIRMKI